MSISGIWCIAMPEDEKKKFYVHQRVICACGYDMQLDMSNMTVWCGNAFCEQGGKRWHMPAVELKRADVDGAE